MEGSAGEIGRLPGECVSRVLSLTSPRDSCRSALVSAAFRSAADSDDVWGRFLPSDYREIVSRAVGPPAFSSLKELYFLLCEGILIDAGRKIFALVKESGSKCYTLCSRELAICWGDDLRYWRWVSDPVSRFAEVALLDAVCWLDICGKINCRELSPDTTYKAYLIYKLTPESYGLTLPAQKASVRLGAQITHKKVCLHPSENPNDHDIDDSDEDLDDSDDEGNLQHDEIPHGTAVPHVRGDGWMEVEMGELYNDDGGDGEVSMSLREVEFLNWKHGIIVEGIQVRPYSSENHRC